MPGFQHRHVEPAAGAGRGGARGIKQIAGQRDGAPLSSLRVRVAGSPGGAETMARLAARGGFAVRGTAWPVRGGGQFTAVVVTLTAQRVGRGN
jgi:hypothetical protein